MSRKERQSNHRTPDPKTLDSSMAELREWIPPDCDLSKLEVGKLIAATIPRGKKWAFRSADLYEREMPPKGRGYRIAIAESEQVMNVQNERARAQNSKLDAKLRGAETALASRKEE